MGGFGIGPHPGGGGGSGGGPTPGADETVPISEGGVFVVRQLNQDDILPAFAPVVTLSIYAVEIGDTIHHLATPEAVSVAYNRPAAGASVSDGSNPPVVLVAPYTGANMPYDYTSNILGFAVVFTVTAHELGGVNKSGSAALIFMEYEGWGVLADPGVYNAAFVATLLGLNEQLAVARQRTEALNGTGVEYEWFAWPSVFGGVAGNFVDVATGFAAGYSKVAGPIAVTNAHGVVTNYDIWRSDNYGLGARNIQVT